MFGSGTWTANQGHSFEELQCDGSAFPDGGGAWSTLLAPERVTFKAGGRTTGSTDASRDAGRFNTGADAGRFDTGGAAAAAGRCTIGSADRFEGMPTDQIDADADSQHRA